MPSLMCSFYSLQKYINITSPLTSVLDLIKMQTNIQTNIHFRISVINTVHVVGNL